MTLTTRWFVPRTLAGGLYLFIALILVLTPTAPALAVPPAGDIEGQIDQAWNKLEPIIEQYNQVHTQLAANQAKAADLQRRLQPLQLEVDAAMSKVSDIAVRMYEGGPATALNAVLTTGSPAGLAEQLGLLNQLAQGQRQQISNVVVTRDKYLADKKALDDLISQQARQDADLAAKKTDIEKQLSDLQKLRQQAHGPGGGTGVLKPVACPVDYVGGPGGVAAKTACSLIGKPYVWAAAGPSGYDCSGLTLAAWAAAGVTLGHFTGSQWSTTKPVSRADLRPGDLVFFFSDLHHEGLYVGGGYMVHAPTSGDYVRMAKIDSPYLPIAGFRRPG